MTKFQTFAVIALSCSTFTAIAGNAKSSDNDVPDISEATYSSQKVLKKTIERMSATIDAPNEERVGPPDISEAAFSKVGMKKGTIFSQSSQIETNKVTASETPDKSESAFSG
ncbi:hypothetical protein DRW07_01685 [Alteromonas sediminis]|uniref:DUF4148 domain-containing protein n=1 Tax=Alteromonas sediminis TaxID=2259342 RepID=A0A3N5ZDH2_9ALTE|nr:hypothetical protein [Alteromonas sediminis]RPJ68148.1 hypothetical protein DRW07_01685 [Alteromonas sediminis]